MLAQIHPVQLSICLHGEGQGVKVIQDARLVILEAPRGESTALQRLVNASTDSDQVVGIGFTFVQELIYECNSPKHVG